MRPRSLSALLLMLGGSAAWVGSPGAGHAQPAPAAVPQSAAPQPAALPHDIPQSLRLEHEDTLARLTTLSKRRGPVGVVASKALALFKLHTAHEVEYILPPLTLLADLADGKATPDMAWALAMTDRVKANREQIFQEHTEVTEILNELLAAGQKAHDKEAIEFAQSAAGDSLNDSELVEPMVVVIGEYLRLKLAGAH